VSANDHVHSRRSAHYAGLALDFQTSDPEGLAATFRQAGYRVLWKVPGHFGHVHVEHDQSGGPLPDARLSIQTPRRAPAARPRAGVPVGG